MVRNHIKPDLFAVEMQNSLNLNTKGPINAISNANISWKMTVFTHTNLCKDRRDNCRQAGRFTHLIWTLWRKKQISGGEKRLKREQWWQNIAKNNMRHYKHYRICDTHCSIQDLSSFCLLLPDSGEGPLWRLVVLFVAGLTLRTHKTHQSYSSTFKTGTLGDVIIHLSESSELLSLWPSSFHLRYLSISSLR